MLNTTTLEAPKSLNGLQKTAKGIAFNCLYKLEIGCLTVIESFAQSGGVGKQVGERFGKPTKGEPSAIIEVKHPEFYRRLLQGGSIAAGEAYMDGWWDSPDLSALMELMAINMAALDSIEDKSSLLTRILYKLGHWVNRNTLAQSRENIQAHYDLGNDLYETFLDERMLYSSGIYATPADTLEQAQINKMERLCQQLKLKSTDQVMEIGTGWGGMAIYMAKQYGCHVTTTTISDEQYQYAAEQVERAGLTDKITLLKQDYRLLEGQYDKLVSIEMIEAVGKQFLVSYLKKCQSLLKPRGLMAIQAITIADQRYDYYADNVDFIQKYIFPGGFLPSITALTSHATQNTDLVVRDLFDIGADYARTLVDWRQRFELSLEKVKALGYDERFIRMWRYYFCYCEGGFRAQSISTVHLTFQRGL
ncbi:SAM-dependent methyltransferase [Vibrio hangzhouensis]|uniref:Cyclopropane-fatty-acyl-phospholipid synthase n=1 Tax=Vibrio hangzhouensis TaxID=462991 RepID=A0A1H5ZWC7_9VIBR|nr:cyclopropane-fatty-acyl-phospholipid synthase family protein [Vibrio hangzhouensis]SEG40749.1 cyclopropane-fatty-acyl-phospholipid synthase [Vibrio hangzhouensis]